MAMFARNLLDARGDARADFLRGTKWCDAEISPLTADMGTRRYLRLARGAETAVLLESLPDGHPDASPGHSMADWLTMNTYLAANGLSVPEVYTADIRTGYMLLEDWGDMTFTRALDDGQDATKLYLLATQAMRAFNALPVPSRIDVPDFFDSHLPRTARRLVDYALPYVRGTRNEDGLVDSFMHIVAQIKAQISGQHGPPEMCLTHTDFHLGNLMWLSRREGIKACGLLDFQNPMRAPLCYDFVNLLFDARRQPDDSIVAQCRKLYTDTLTPAERASFAAWEAFVAFLFHARVTGQFLKAGLMGHTYYLQFVPIVAGHLLCDLQNPVLEPVADFMAAHKVNLDFSSPINIERLRPLVRTDAV